MLDVKWALKSCKALTSRIGSLTLLDVLSNRCHFWYLPLVLEMRDLNHGQKCLLEYHFRGQCIASRSWVQLKRCGLGL